MITRPLLDSIPLEEGVRFAPGTMTVTMSIGQWDEFLSAGYAAGWILLELDNNERPVAAYRRQEASTAE